MILKLCLYPKEGEIGKKFLTIDNIADLRSVYAELSVEEIRGKDKDIHVGTVVVGTSDANDVIRDLDVDFDFSKQPKIQLLKLEFRQKKSEYYTDLTYYTDNEVYVCNDDGQTIEKFRLL